MSENVRRERRIFEAVGPMSAKEILELGRRPRQSLVSQMRDGKHEGQEPLNIIPEHSYTLLAAESGHGKTWLALDLARLMATEHSQREEPLLWLGLYKVEPRRVLYLDKENGGHSIGKRLEQIGLKDTANLIVWSRNQLKIDSQDREKGIDKILKYCEQEAIQVIFLDSLVRFHGQDENAAQPMAEVSDAMRNLVDAGLTVIALHHTHKGKGRIVDRFRGSSEITAGTDTVLFLEQWSSDENKFTLYANKLRYANKHEFRTHYIWRKEETGRISFVYAGEYQDKKTDSEPRDKLKQSVRNITRKPPGMDWEVYILKQILNHPTGSEAGMSREEIKGHTEDVNKAIKSLLGKCISRDSTGRYHITEEGKDHISNTS